MPFTLGPEDTVALTVLVDRSAAADQLLGVQVVLESGARAFIELP
jgi:hypothetical protein